MHGDVQASNARWKEKVSGIFEQEYDTLPKYCKECPVLYLCAGYKAFFTHIDQSIKTMAELLEQGRYAGRDHAGAEGHLRRPGRAIGQGVAEARASPAVSRARSWRAAQVRIRRRQAPPR
jgi:hypothetical protein